jgi:murein L,D-transpeptidase YcbB/YkuD
MTTPPAITATSRIAVWMCTGMRSTKTLAKKAPGNATAPIRSAKASTCAVTTPANPNTEILITLVTTEITASVAITAAFEAGGHQQRQQDHAGARGAANQDTVTHRAKTEPGVTDPDIVALEQTAQRHARYQHGADHQRRAGVGQPCIAIRTERGREPGRRDHDQRAAAIHITQIGGKAAEIGEDRGDGDDRHHRLGADQRHQNQRHQRAGAVAREASDHRSQQRDTCHQQQLRQRDIGKAGNDGHAR